MSEETKPAETPGQEPPKKLRNRKPAETPGQEQEGDDEYRCTQATFWLGRVWKPGEITAHPDAALAPHCFEKI